MLVFAVALIALGINQAVEAALGHLVAVVDTLCVLTMLAAGGALIVSQVRARRPKRRVREPTIRRLLAAERKERLAAESMKRPIDTDPTESPSS